MDKNKTNILKTIGLIASTTVAVGCLGVAGYAIADSVVKQQQQSETEVSLIKATVTHDTIVIAPIENAEYSLDGVIYQDSNIFTNLQPVTEYTVFVRIKATADTPASTPVTTRVTTDKAPQAAPEIVVEAIAGTSVRVSLLPNCEYRIDGGTWQDNSAFANLKENTQYTIQARYKETATFHQSDIAEILVTTTNATAGYYDTNGAIVYTWQQLKQYGYVTVQQNVLTEVELDSGMSGTLQLDTEVYSIGSQAFGGGTNHLSKVIIPSSVRTIGANAFDGMQNLTEVTLPPQMEEIKGGAFSQCPNLKTVNLPTGITKINDYTFYKCYALGQINIPNTVTSIGKSAFEYCENLTKVSLSENLTEIGINAFLRCTSLNEIEIPNTVAKIGSQAFGNTSIRNVVLPENLQEFACNAFANSEIQNYTISPNNEIYGTLDGVLYGKQNDTLLAYPCGRLSAFYNIPKQFDSIGANAFSGAKIQSLNVPSTIERVDNSAFSNCANLETVIVDSAMIQNSVFSGCTALTNITFGENVQQIGTYILSGCYNLESITILATTPPELASVFMARGEQNKLAEINIPTGSLLAYTSDPLWINYQEIFKEI